MTAPPDTTHEDRIIEEAAAWYAQRLDSGLDRAVGLHDVTTDQAFEDWLNADPRHRDAYALIARTGDDVVLAVPSSDYRSQTQRRTDGRRWSLLLAAAGVTIALVATAIGLLIAGSSSIRKTGVGETELIALDDGTRVNLSASSEIKVRFDGKQRQIILRRGEAFFDVGRDPKRPFSVVAGDTIVRDIGTQFNVNLREQSLEVSVVKGEVSIASTSESAPPLAVKASQRARVDISAGNNHVMRPATPDAPAPVPVAAVQIAPLPAQSAIALREGRQFYEDAALGDIVEDLNRYYPPGISLASADIAGRRLTASLAPRDIDAFLAGLPITAGVAVRRSSDGHVTILAQSAPPGNGK